MDLWSFYLFLTVVLMCLLTIQPGVFFSVEYCDLSRSKIYLLYYLMYRKGIAVELDVFERPVAF